MNRVREGALGALVTVGLFAAGLLAAGLGAPPLRAEDASAAPRAVLELFTSQGCSSCPPADALLAELSQREDVVALAYHIDYWDYIGWPDTFGDPAFSEHQRAYAKSWGGGPIYTPQLVVNGAVDVVGSRRLDVLAAIAATDLTVPVSLSVDAGVFSIDADGEAGVREAVVWLVTFIGDAEVTIEGGENGGRRLRYAQVVTARQMLGLWEPGAGAHIKLPIGEVLLDQSSGAAVLIQQQNGDLPGPIIGAALYRR